MEDREGEDAQLAVPRNLALLLAALSSLGSLAIDTYLPAFDDIENSLGASQIEVQQTLSCYLLAFAIFTPAYGALSDSFGRRPVILVGVLVFVLASFGCMLAPNIETLWLFRFVQGASAGTGLVSGRAVVRDLTLGADAQRLMSSVTAAFAIAPLVAPLLGGIVQVYFGWRAVFLLLALLSLAIGTWCVFSLPETLDPTTRRPLRLVSIPRDHARVLLTPSFAAGALANSVAFAGFFVYVLSAPAFVVGLLGRRETEFAWLFLPITAGMVLGSSCARWAAGRMSPESLIRVGFTAMAVAGTSNFLLHQLRAPSLPWSIVPIFFFVVGYSMMSPPTILATLDLLPGQRGLSSSCQSLVSTTTNALVASLLAPLLWDSATSLAAGQCILVAVSLFFWQAFKRLCFLEDEQSDIAF